MPRGIVCSPPPRYRLSVSTCAAKVRASLLKARSHCPVAEIFTAARFLILEKIETDHREILKFPESETRISAGMGEINSRVPVISMTHLPRFTPLLWLSGGSSACAYRRSF